MVVEGNYFEPSLLKAAWVEAEEGMKLADIACYSYDLPQC